MFRFLALNKRRKHNILWNSTNPTTCAHHFTQASISHWGWKTPRQHIHWIIQDRVLTSCNPYQSWVGGFKSFLFSPLGSLPPCATKFFFKRFSFLFFFQNLFSALYELYFWNGIFSPCEWAAPCARVPFFKWFDRCSYHASFLFRSYSVLVLEKGQKWDAG